MKISRYIKPESAASGCSFRYSAAVFAFPISARVFAGLGILACTACVGNSPKPDATSASRVFYTVTAEIALSRHEARVAALEYAAAAENDRDVGILRRATEVATQCLQPSLTVRLATRWMAVDPAAVDAHRAAAGAALELHEIEQATVQYRAVLASSPRGTEAEFAVLETELAASGNVYGARQLADRLAQYFPASSAASRLRAFAALRGDDPAAAVGAFQAALTELGGSSVDAERRALTEGLWRARILAGDGDEPLAQAKELLERDGTAENRLDYAMLLLAAQQEPAAREQLVLLMRESDSAPVALRLLGLLDFQDGKLDDAGARFAELVTTGKFLDDALYYLGLIADRHKDWERALRLYAQVRSGENAIPALLRAAILLRAHGAAPAAEELLDQLVAEEPQRAPEILAARARIYSDAGELPQAIRVLDQGELQYPDSVELRYAQASMAEAQGRIAVALRVLKELAARRPGDPAALNAYGYTLADNNVQLGEARRLIEQAYAAAPKSAAFADSLGWVLFRQGHGVQALPYLNAAYSDDRDGDIAAHLGEVLWQLGRRADAERIWSEAINRSGADNPLINATRRRLHAST